MRKIFGLPFLLWLLFGIDQTLAGNTFVPQKLDLTSMEIGGLCRDMRHNVSGLKREGQDVDVCQERQVSGEASRRMPIDWRGGPPLTPQQLKLRLQEP